jgi:hypothetical protein
VKRLNAKVKIRMVRSLVWIINAGECGKLSTPCTRVKPLGVTLPTDGHRCVEEDLHEPKAALRVQELRRPPVGGVRTYERNDRDHSKLYLFTRELSDSADHLRATCAVKPEVAPPLTAKNVAVEQGRWTTASGQVALEGACERGLARGRQPGDPDRRAGS